MTFQLRAGLNEDWPLIRTLMRRSLEDDTYVNGSVWQEWASGGATTVLATDGPRVIGVGSMRRLSAASWWMEGPIVHPDALGSGAAVAIVEHLIDDFRERGDGILRTGNFSNEEDLATMLEDLGFIHIISNNRIEAPTAAGDFGHFSPLVEGDLELAMAYLRTSPMFRFASFFERGNLLDYLTDERVKHYLGQSDVTTLAWTQWETISGIVMLTINPAPPNHDAMYINYIDAMEDTTLRLMLNALSAAAYQNGKQRLVWKMPLSLGLESSVTDINFHEVWSAPFKLYELPL